MTNGRSFMRAGMVAAIVIAVVALLAGAAVQGARPATVAAPRVSATQKIAARTVTGWTGGWVTTSTGERVRVFVSDAAAARGVAAGDWANFFAGLVHGSEFSTVTVWVALLDEIPTLCGADALGCYFPYEQSLYMPADRVDSALIAAHEYGHHVARNRPNPPWAGDTHGPKRWATVENVCVRAQAGKVFPGNEDDGYMLNPGEGFAEVYRALNAMKAGTPFEWPIVDWSFYPSAADLQAAEADVTKPWLTATETTSQHRLSKKTPRWTAKLTTSLDGTLDVSVTLSRAVPVDVTLLSGDRGKVLARGVWVAPKERQLRYTICGQRSFVLRVAMHGAAVTATVRTAVP